MQIYPAIDLCDGKCVRLYKGDFATAHIYNDDPVAMLAAFASAGSCWAHIVDLDGAKSGRLTQAELIQGLAASKQIKLEVGGGIRTSAEIELLLNAGVERVVVGSVCVTNPQLVNQWLATYGGSKIVLALDCSLDAGGVPRVRTHGWQTQSELSVYQVIDSYPGVQYILCTDVGVDGTLAGPSMGLYQQLQQRYPQLNIIASGGVGSLSDIEALRQLGLHGVVVGKALYEQRFSLEDALSISA